MIERRRVRVWFGEHAIRDHVAATDLADRYAQAMRRRFAGLRITNEALPESSPDPASPGARSPDRLP